MNWQSIKDKIPQPVKFILRPFYRMVIKIRTAIRPYFYKNRLADELARFNKEVEVNDLPEIFHYWSNKYLVPKFTEHGFSNPDSFLLKYAQSCINKQSDETQILSIGSGNCDTEIRLACQLKQLNLSSFKITCMDINPTMLARGKIMAEEREVIEHIDFLVSDFNLWKASNSYHLIIANQCLHHVTKLEHLYDQINSALKHDGYFITSDVIGRNGHQRWPEALNALKPLWQNMPDRYKYNHAMQRFEKTYINHDCSTEGFEGIRAQDVLPLLTERFQFELIVPFANLIMVFIDRPFGPNFDPNNAEDRAFIDQVHHLDEQLIQNGTLKPTQMMAAMKKAKNKQNLAQINAKVIHQYVRTI